LYGEGTRRATGAPIARVILTPKSLIAKEIHMSPGLLQKTVSFAVALSAAACSAQPENHPTSIEIKDAPSQSLVALAAKPASLGWQDQARTLVGVNNMSPLAAREFMRR